MIPFKNEESKLFVLCFFKQLNIQKIFFKRLVLEFHASCMLFLIKNNKNLFKYRQKFVQKIQ